MQTIKPDVHLILPLQTALIIDAGNLFSLRDLDVKRDIATISNRVAKEGLAFLTKTLPKLGKHFDSALQSGKFVAFTAFKKQPKGVLPSFLKGLTALVFAKSGTLLDDPDVDAIRLLRQLCFLFYKLEGDYPKDLVDAKISDFFENDASLNHCDTVSVEQAGIVYQAQQLISLLFSDFDADDICPRPGPGQTADRTSHEKRYEPHTLYKEVHEVYPYYRYFYTNSKHLLDRVRNYKNLPRVEEGVSSMTDVPKDSRGPRLICKETSEYMWFQQGLGRSMMSHLESHWLTAGHVNFTDQSINQYWALQGSRDGETVTLDMKDASDNQTKALVEVVYDDVPNLRQKLLSLSTKWIQAPNKAPVRVNKFAPMGSALCFPSMSVLHYVLMLSSIMVTTGCSVHKAKEHVFVYGDDLVCHRDHASFIMEDLAMFGLKFNPDKCCMNGRFRESCGVDAYAGVDVTPLKIKKFSSSKSNPDNLSTYLAYFKSLFHKGLWNAASVLRQHVESTWGKLPVVGEASSALGWPAWPNEDLYRVNLIELGFRWKYSFRAHQDYVLRVRVTDSSPDRSMIGGWEQLVRSQNHAIEDSGKIVPRYRTKFKWRNIPMHAIAVA